MTTDFKKVIRISAIMFLFIFIIVYAFFKSKYLIFGVKIIDLNIENNTKITEEIIEIKGNAKNAIYLAINDREIYIDKEGNFKEYHALYDGYNFIKIDAKDKFGNKDEKKINIIGEFVN